MAHTLTISGWKSASYYKVPTVNGIAKTDSDSPITLKNGDIIKVPTDRASVKINGTSYIAQSETLALSNQDIALVASGAEKTLEVYHWTTIYYTESGGSTMKSYDLSTSSKWAALADGDHQITIVAKGTGYRDSNPSTPITVTKGAVAGNTLTVESVYITA